MKQQHKFIATKDIKCYKGTNAQMQCADEFQFELNKVVVMPKENISLCARGFHGSFDLFYVQQFYSPRGGARYFEAVIPKGSTVMLNPCNKDKFVANSIKLIRELSFAEAYKMLNKGDYNLGFGNVGNNNVGVYNVGNNNEGNNNLGNYNEGSCNNGSFNIGNLNIGNNNEGNNNKGNYNVGNYNKGNDNLGSYNKGNFNKGNDNKGSLNHF